MNVRTYRSSRKACSLSSDWCRLLNILEALCSTGRPDHRLSRAVCQLDVCAGTGQDSLLGHWLTTEVCVHFWDSQKDVIL